VALPSHGQKMVKRMVNLTMDSPSRSSLPESAVLIRQFRPHDLSDVMDLDREVHGSYDPQLFVSFYELHPRTLLVAEQQGRVVGFILGFKSHPLQGRIFWLAVQPAYQGQGLGRRLLTALLTIFRRLGAPTATLEVRISNSQALALYTSMGFEPVTVIPSYYGDGEAALIMQKRL